MIIRTLKLRLRPDAHQAALLLEARQAVTDSFNQVCSLGWEHQLFNGVELHKATYQAHRALFKLPSQLAISARMKATEALLSARDRQRKGKPVSRPHSEYSWSFAQLQGFVKYKAEAKGVQVVLVDPRYTSQKCCQCAYVSRSNRPEQAVFTCRECGFTCHADYNAALNIRANHLKSQGLPVNQPIVAIQELTPFVLVTSSGL